MKDCVVCAIPLNRLIFLEIDAIVFTIDRQLYCNPIRFIYYSIHILSYIVTWIQYKM